MTPVYLHLFHGRTDPKQDMQGWGSKGPTLGPLDYVQITYANLVRIRFINAADAAEFNLDQDAWFNLYEECLSYGGVLYGDWAVDTRPPPGAYGRGAAPAEEALRSTHN